MRQSLPYNRANETEETEKVPVFVVKEIREAILDEVFQPGDRLVEGELAEKFEVSRSPVREAFLALEKEGTLINESVQGCSGENLCRRQRSWISRNSGWPLSL
jgi:DNA-binding GntR family transcriptional regulator